MKFEKSKRRVAPIKAIISVPIIVPWYPDTVSVGMCCARSDRRLPFGLSPAVRHIHAHVQTVRTGCRVGWTGGGIAGAGLGWSFCVAVQRRSTSANALPHRTTRYKGYHQDGNHSEFGSHHREVGGSLRRRPQGVWQARIELRMASRELTAWRPAAGARAERSRFDVVLKSARITSDLNQ